MQPEHGLLYGHVADIPYSNCFNCSLSVDPGLLIAMLVPPTSLFPDGFSDFEVVVNYLPVVS